MGLPQPRAAVDKQGVVEDGGLGGHGLAGGVGKAVGGPHHEGVEGELVVLLAGAVPLGLLGLQLLVDADLEGEVVPKDALEGLLEDVAVAPLQGALVELVGHFQHGHPRSKSKDTGLRRVNQVL